MFAALKNLIGEADLSDMADAIGSLSEAADIAIAKYVREGRLQHAEELASAAKAAEDGADMLRHLDTFLAAGERS